MMTGTMDRSRLLSAVTVLARTAAAEDEWLTELRVLGFSESEAHRAIAFIPVGFSRPVLERLGVTEFADVASILLSNGETVEIRLGDQPEYVAALSAARDYFAQGSLSRDAFEAVMLRSADVAAISTALEKNADIRGGTIATAFHDGRLARHAIR